MEGAPIQIEAVSHHFGAGELRKQILFDVSTQIRAGEIVILTGPSGSGKTTLLTLIGALRSAQQGSVRVLGAELCGARPRELIRVRRQIGYIFQLHNLLDCLTAEQNVRMALELHGGLSRRQMRRRAEAMLASVGLAEKTHHYAAQLSGGQKQRVAIARALVSEPKIILADEPTASLDRKSGRDVVDLMQRLAKEHGVTVVLVTHDNRILDIADRILHLEDGRLVPFGEAVLANTRQLMSSFAEMNRRGALAERIRELPDERFGALLEQVTAEAQQFLRASELAQGDAFESLLDQALAAFTARIGEMLRADRASLWLLDEGRGELWSKVARDASGALVELRVPYERGIAGAVASTGKTLNIADAYADPRFDRSADLRTGYRTRSILCVPLLDHHSQVFGVAQLLNRSDGAPFDAADEARFGDFMASMGVILESWWRMARRTRETEAGAEPG